MIANQQNTVRFAPLLNWLLVCSLLAVVFATFGDYGFSTDENFGSSRAETIIAYLQGSGKLGFELRQFYGAMPDVLAYAIGHAVPQIGISSRHLIGGLFGVVGVVYTYRLAAMLFSPMVGYLAALFLATNPMWNGYAFFNLKDVPLAALVVATLYYVLVSLIQSLTWQTAAKLALAVGLLSVTKIIALVIVLIMVACFAPFVWESLQTNSKQQLLAKGAGMALASIIGPLLCFAVFWPQFYSYSFQQLGDVLAAFRNFDQWQGKVLLAGISYPYNQVPRWYISTYFIVSMPLLLLFASAFGTCMAFRLRNLAALSTVAIVALFFGYQAVTGAKVYSGYRHFLFLLPFIMIIAAFPIGHLLTNRKCWLTRCAVGCPILLHICLVASSIAQTYPYQYTQYNAVVGGLPGAEDRYYVDIWNTASREAMTYLASVNPGSTISVYTISSSFNGANIKGINLVTDPAEANFIISSPRSSIKEIKGLNVVHIISRQGVAMATIYANLPIRSESVAQKL